MNVSFPASLLSGLIGITLLIGCGEEPITVIEGDATIIENVRLFDGERTWQQATVVIKDEHIVHVAVDDKAVRIEGMADRVDGTAHTLMPGFIDGHFHSIGELFTLRDSLRFGVTTVLDVFSPDQFIEQFREQIAAVPAGSLPDFFTAGTCATAPNGHGTQFGAEIDTLSSPEEVEPWLATRLARGVDFIKIIAEPGGGRRQFGNLDASTISALVQKAHEQGLLTVAHAQRYGEAEKVIAGDVDGIIHLWHGGATDEMIAALLEKEIFVAPTPSVLEPLWRGDAGGMQVIGDPRVEPYLSDEAVENLQLRRPRPEVDGLSYEELAALVKQLHGAGVPIVAGPDSPNPGTWAGVSMHRELELLVEAGLSREAALHSATAAAADAYRLADRGRVAEGSLADLILVRGDPTTDISATLDITTIWRRGIKVNRSREQEE